MIPSEILSIRSVLSNLQNTTKTNEKIDILKSAAHIEELKNLFCYTYDKVNYKYYMRGFEIPETEFHNTIMTEKLFYDSFKILDDLNNRVVTGNAAKELVTEHFKKLPYQWYKIFNNVLERDLRCGVSKTTVNKIWKGAIFKLNLQKPESFSKELLDKFKFPAIADIKEDGGLSIVTVKDNECKMYSSSGTLINGLESQKQEAVDNLYHKTGIVYQAELVAFDSNGNRLPRKDSNGIMNKVLKGTATLEEQESIKVIVFDSIMYDNWVEGKEEFAFKYRIKQISEPLKECKYFDEVERHVVNSIEEVKDLFLKVLNRGLEGLVLKDPFAGWQSKRVKNQIKLKLEKVSDLRIVGITEGKGKYKNSLGSVICTTDDGEIQVGVSGFTDEMRDEIWNNQKEFIYKIIKVLHNGVIEHEGNGIKSLFLPRFAGMHDKNVTDDLAKVSSLTYGNVLFGGCDVPETA